jgi:hypothetical protein
VVFDAALIVPDCRRLFVSSPLFQIKVAEIGERYSLFLGCTIAGWIASTRDLPY